MKKVKFIHIADVHLGANPEAGRAYSDSRGRELWDAFATIIHSCEEQQIELLLIAGDLFHRQPLLGELKEVNSLFAELTVTKVVFIVGNHDYMKLDSYYRTFSWCDNVYPLLGRDMETITFANWKLSITGCSYHTREISDISCLDGCAHDKTQAYDLLLLHAGDEKHIPVQKKHLLPLHYDYIALGHIHKPQIIESNRIIYAGALEPTDKNDIGPHGYIKGEITPQGIHTQFVDSAVRSYIHKTIEVNQEMTGNALKMELKRQIEETGIRHLYRIKMIGFRDPEILFDLEHMDIYGNIIDIVDETSPAYNFARLKEQNAGNILGKYIVSLENSEVGSTAYQALYEGVQAILETRE